MLKFIEVKNYASSLLETINVADVIKFEADFHEKKQTILHLRDSKNSYFQIEEPYDQFKKRMETLLNGKEGVSYIS